MAFNCEHCKYTTSIKANYNKHIKTIRHLSKMNNDIVIDTDTLKTNIEVKPKTNIKTKSSKVNIIEEQNKIIIEQNKIIIEQNNFIINMFKNTNKNIVVEESNNNVVVNSSNDNVVIEESNNDIFIEETNNDIIVVEESNDNVLIDSSNDNVVIDSSNDNVVIKEPIKKINIPTFSKEEM